MVSGRKREGREQTEREVRRGKKDRNREITVNPS